MLSDADKCKLINLKEELEVFLLNRAVCYAISQSSIRKEFEESIEFFNAHLSYLKDSTQSRLHSINECTKRFENLKHCRISTFSHKKLYCLCKLLFSKILLFDTPDTPDTPEKIKEIDESLLKAQKDIENKSIPKIPLQDQKVLFKEWKRLLTDLRYFLSTLNENQSEINLLLHKKLQDRLKKYEDDLIVLHQKNEYRDTLYMEFYKVSKALYSIDPVFYVTLQKDSENFDFYNDINTTEFSLRTQIKELSKFESESTHLHVITDKFLEKSKKKSVKRKRVQESHEQTFDFVQSQTNTQSPILETVNNKFVKRGGPKYCPGCPSVNPTHQPHTCVPKTVFFPFLLDKIERCLQCHEQIVLFNGGKIQKSFSEKRKN